MRIAPCAERARAAAHRFGEALAVLLVVTGANLAERAARALGAPDADEP